MPERIYKPSARYSKRTPKRLWEDVPAGERVTEEFLSHCVGADVPGWLDDQLRHLRSPKCRAAVKWYREDNLWAPCRQAVMRGERYCTFHGGKGKKTSNLLRRKIVGLWRVLRYA